MWYDIGRPGAIGSRKQEIISIYDEVYGIDNWRLVHKVAGQEMNIDQILYFYEDAYRSHFQSNMDQIEWIANNALEVYDNNPSNVNSGFDYHIQEFGGNHYQDITIRRLVKEFGLKFNGEELLEIRTKGAGAKWNPSNIPFHKMDLMPEELKGWWKEGSVESFYQSTKYLQVKEVPEDIKALENADIVFVTGNEGKFNAAKLVMGDKINLMNYKLNISEEQIKVAEIAEHKAKVASSILCKPIIVDDSGFVIPSLKGYPGSRVGRELEEKGLEYFQQLAKDGPVECYWEQVLAYYDVNKYKPEFFISTSPGVIVKDKRGEKKSYMKSDMGYIFVPESSNKTISEMSEEEYKQLAKTNRWNDLSSFLKERSNISR